MATDSPYKTFQNIYEAVLLDFKENTSGNIVNLAKRWVNEGQEQVILRKKRDYLNKTFDYVTEAPVESTFSVTEDSTTVTLTGSATLPTSSVNDHKFQILGSDDVYNVSSIGTSTITLTSGVTRDTSTAVTGILFQTSILLDDTIRSVHKVYHDNGGGFDLFAKGPEDFRGVITGDNTLRDFANFWTLYGYDSQSVSSADPADQKKLMLYPYPHKKYTLHVDANIDIPSLINDTDEPLIPIQHRQILYWYGVSKMALYHQDSAAQQAAERNFNTFLAKIDGSLLPGRDLPQIQRDNISWRNGMGDYRRGRTFKYTRGSD